ncbi:hypothetical protein BGZ65_011577 [Modicella reniformis]|uniref:Bromo domain-containing protein n=1 Tax=Modicella reniformis TaxID=1440133 RepID=A0A9P6IM87_9FUNG|nr:hypothetical protein BGZ65_011577 [Modicella reniformis]
MSFAGYFFGNVDESGKVEDLPEEFREALESLENSEQLIHLFSAKTLGVDETEVQTQAYGSGTGDNDEDEDEDQDGEVNFSTIKSTFDHAKDAVDFSEINDLAADNTEQEMFNNRYLQRGLAAVKANATTAMKSSFGGKGQSSRLDNMDEDYDAEDTDEETSKRGSHQPSPPLIALPFSHALVKPAMTLLQQQQIYLWEEQQKQQQQTAGGVGSKSVVPALPTLPVLPAVAAPTAVAESIDVHAIYPAFEENKILKFSELFNTKRPKRFPHSRAKPAQFPTTAKFSKNHDQRKAFEQPEDPSIIQGQDLEYYDTMEGTVDKEWANSLEWKVPTTKELYSVQLEAWEDKIIWDDAVVPSGSANMDMNGTGKEVIKKSSTAPTTDLFAVRNYDLENGDWEESIIWDENKPYKPFTQISLNMNDANVLFDLTTMDTKAMGDAFRGKRGKKVQLPAYRVVTKNNDPSEAETNRNLQIDRFNLSNDRFYEIHKEGRFHRVRQTFGQLVVQHALPAVKLMKPWYKNKLTKSELRSFHRPQLQATPNVDITFARVKGSKKKKQKRKELGEVMRSSKDLTLRDNTNFVLLEYSEEHPAIIQNVGMGSFLINYYRKEAIDDTHLPQGEIGEPFVLDIADASPFLNFGNVEPGQTISALYNNLIRAPVFEQPARNTDFLVIKTTYKGETKYYIRHIPHLYIVGQTYPVQDVPGPHSRKITTMIKNRLQISAFRFIRKDLHSRLRFAKLVKAYPEYSEIQIRQRLKEFAEFQRKGNNTGFWKLKASVPLPSEEEIRKLVTPEMVCLYEGMLVGQRHLLDAGYGRAADGEDDANEDNEANMDIEEQLAPWITTRNFINATQGKAMLKLWGAGDPTGRGEGFSFVRISMKDIFLRQGESLEERLAQIELLPKSTHRYNVAEQQQVYREEITRIWNAQHRALSNNEEIDGHNDEIAGSDEDEEETYNRQRRELSVVDRNRASPSPSLFGRYRDRERDRDRDHDIDDDNASVAGSISSRTSGNFGASRNKYLVIKRLIRQPNGEAIWKSETIRDPAVMNNYIRHRQLIEESAISTEALEPTDDEAKNERRKKRILEEIARLNRNQERRLARAAAKAGTAPPEMPINPITASLKKKVVRQCSNCGALGHMKTNKKCPKYVDPSGALPNLGVTGATYVASGGIGGIGNIGGIGGMGNMISPPHVPLRQTSIPPVAPATMARGGSVNNGEFFGQGSPQSSSTGGNKISIPKAVIDRVVDQEKEREKEDKEALLVRLPTKMLQPTPPKRKRSESTSHQNNDLEDFMDYLHPPIKSYGRRKKADVELANIIESVLSTILSMQEANAFINPVSSKIAPGYDIVIKHPRDLSGMRDANKNYYAYRTVDAFLTDMRIMVNNSWIYNGEHSPFTKAAMVLLEKAGEILNPQMETIRQLEQEILDADMKANLFGVAGTPGGMLSATGTPPPSGLLPPGGYGLYTSTTFTGIGKPFLGFMATPTKNNIQPLPVAVGSASTPVETGTGEVQVKAEAMEWE